MIKKTNFQKPILSMPMIGAQVFIEPGQTHADIDSFFRILHENQLSICRIRMFEKYMRTADGDWDFDLFDQAFTAAEKYSIKIMATLFPMTAFTDVGGFKFPHTQTHLVEIADYIEHLVSHFQTFPALWGWVLINEPGARELPDEEFTHQAFARWQAKQTPPAYQSSGYFHFDFAEERFLLDYNTWFLNWLATQIQRYDPHHHLHVNNHAIFQLAAEYNFPVWRNFLSSLGGSAHASWHFGYFDRSQYALAMAADCQMIASGAGEIPWLMTEIQGGNNIYSGFNVLCPTREEIEQWLWVILGSGGKGGIFWSLNARASGFEAGEWALLDFHNQPSDRLQAAAAVSKLIHKHSTFFKDAQPLKAPIHIVYIRESLWVEKKLQTGGTPYIGREVGGVMKSALSYFETLTELGIPCHFSEISEFDFSQSSYADTTIILAHQISVPSRYWKQLETFVQHGGKLIIDGLTAYYDENAHCIMMGDFPLAQLCGASITEFKLKGNLFDVQLTQPAVNLSGHCWQGNLQCSSATPIGFDGEAIIASRNQFGAGEVLWVPTLLGLGARLTNHAALAALLSRELAQSFAAIPFRFSKHYSGVLMRTLVSGNSYLVVFINKNIEPVNLQLIAPAGYQAAVLSPANRHNLVPGVQIHLDPEKTLVTKWETNQQL